MKKPTARINKRDTFNSPKISYFSTLRRGDYKFFILLITLFPIFATVCFSEPYTCVIEPNNITGVVHRELFGTNIEWFNNGNGIWNTETNSLDKELVSLAKQQGLSLIRFPGGTLSDFYHWQNGIGPQHLRPISPHHTDPAESANVFGSPELIRFCKLTNTKPLITVNVGTGTAEDAAAWVAYMNLPNHSGRAQDGYPEPINVHFWEIGNELYLNGTDAENKITLSPEEYCQKFVAYANAMKKVDPSISLIAPGVAGSYTIPFGPYSNWNQILLENIGHTIDYIALHNGYFPVLINKHNDVKTVYQSLWGAALSVDQDLSRLEKLIQQSGHAKSIQIAITEWGPFFSFADPEWTDHVKTMGSAIYAARMFQTFFDHPMVKISTYFKYTDNTFMGWVSYKKVPKIPYHVVRLYANHFGSTMVRSTIDSPVFSSKQVGLTPAAKNIPVLNVRSSVSENRNNLYINIVSCSWDKELEVNLDIIDDADTFQKNGVIRILSAGSALAHNGEDLPSWWPVKAIEPSADNGETTILTQLFSDWRKPIKIPPASVVIIELHK